MKIEDKPIISVVLGSYNRCRLLKSTIESVRKELESIRGEILVVDGGSTDGTIDWLVQQKDIVSIIQHNRGQWRGQPITKRSWGYFMNLIFKAAQGKYVCMISDDCLVIPGAIVNGYRHFESELAKGRKIGATAFYYRDYPSDKNEYSVHLTLDKKIYVNHGLYLKKALEEVGYIDEDSYQFYCADCDLIMKLDQAGYACIDAPESFIEHASHANITLRLSNEQSGQADMNAYLKKWNRTQPEGGAITKEFIDPNQTYKKFGQLMFFKAKIVLATNKLIRKIVGKGITTKIKAKLINRQT